MIEAFFASLAVVSLAEIGDRTMLLAIMLSARLRAPWQILAGIFVATIANHALAALLGSEVAGLADALWFRLAVALFFIAMAGWLLLPEKEEDEAARLRQRSSAFLTTLVAFFLVEIGDRTQIATIALGAHYHSVLAVTAGTTLGMTLANGPAVFFGEKVVERISLKPARIGAALVVLALGLWQIVEILGSL